MTTSLVPRLLVTLSSNNIGIARDDANAALRKRIKISAASSLFQTLVSFREWLAIFAKFCLSVTAISDWLNQDRIAEETSAERLLPPMRRPTQTR
jgi:hypothetical protein